MKKIEQTKPFSKEDLFLKRLNLKQVKKVMREIELLPKVAKEAEKKIAESKIDVRKRIEVNTERTKDLLDSKETKILTLQNAEILISPPVTITTFIIDDPKSFKTFKAKEIISEWEYNKREKDVLGYESRTDYWASYMSEEEIEICKNRLILIDSNGRDTKIYCEPDNNKYFKEPTFYYKNKASQVYFIVN